MSNNEELQLIHKGAVEAKKHLLLAHEATIDALQGVRNKYTEGERLDPALEDKFRDISAVGVKGLEWLDALINSTKS